MKLRLASRVILSIDRKNNYVSKISRVVNATHSAIAKTIIDLEDISLVQRTKQGTKIYISLTEKGKKVQRLLYELQRTLQ